MIHLISTTLSEQKDQISSLANWQRQSFLKFKYGNQRCIKAVSSSLHMITKTFLGGKNVSKCFHLSHTKGIFLSPALYSQHQVLILPLAMILIFSSPRLRPAPSVQQCCLYLFHSAWDIWVSVWQIPFPSPNCRQTGLQVTRFLRWVSPATELSITSPSPSLFLPVFTKQTVNSTSPPSGGHTSTA